MASCWMLTKAMGWRMAQFYGLQAAPKALRSACKIVHNAKYFTWLHIFPHGIRAAHQAPCFNSP